MSIRKRAMDLLFTMCTPASADEVVKELLAYLVVADFSMREELVLKIAFLAEKFAPSVQWWVQGWPGGRVCTQCPVVGACSGRSGGGGGGCAPCMQLVGEGLAGLSLPGWTTWG